MIYYVIKLGINGSHFLSNSSFIKSEFKCKRQGEVIMIKINLRKISRHKSGDIDSKKRNNSTEWLADKIHCTIIKRTLFINILLGIVVFPLILISLGCDDSNDDDDELIGNWFELSDFEGVPRSGAVVFCIDDKAYIGTGYDGTDRLNDFWRYDPAVDGWTRIADFPGSPRNGAVAFATDSKGYVGTGYDGKKKLKDFWEYDPQTNSWTQIDSLIGTARYGAVAFAINNKGYVGTGYDGWALKDFYEYDPATGQWTQKLSLRGGKRQNAVAFVIDNKGYVCTGIDNASYETDLWEYDPILDTWTRKRDIADVSDDDYDDDYSNISGIYKVSFSLNGKGYIATGGYSSPGSYVWEYDPILDLWEQKTSFESSGRIEAVGFSIGNIGYITTGRNSSYYFDDLWGFYPDVEQVDND